VTGIDYLPQVATCGYENQALRAAKMAVYIYARPKTLFLPDSKNKTTSVARKSHIQ
jgi:hypothetical protein